MRSCNQLNEFNVTANTYMTQEYGLYSYLPKEPTEELPVDRLISHLIKSLP